MQSISFNLQAIERSGTGITYLQLLMSMSQVLEQLSAQQGKLPPKLPTEVGGMFGGLLNKLVTSPTQTGLPLNAQPCLLVSENGEISTQAFTSNVKFLHEASGNAYNLLAQCWATCWTSAARGMSVQDILYVFCAWDCRWMAQWTWQDSVPRRLCCRAITLLI